MPLTLAELAARVCSKGDDLSSVTERIRHWARRGLLEGGDPGRGSSRMFDRHAVIDAAVMNALSDVMGVAVLRMGRETLARTCDEARTLARSWAFGDRRPCWLELVWVRSGIDAGGLAYGHVGELKLHGGTEANLILDMRNVFGRLRWARADEDEAEREFQETLKKRSKRGHK
jgi:hypothetical protein